MEEKIREILLQQVNPLLEEHFGGVKLQSYEDGVAVIKMTGACGTCASAQITTDEVVRKILMENLPEIQDVVLDTSVSDELMDFARKLLNKEVQL